MTRPFTGQLHGPGQPDAGAPVTARFVGNRLQVGADPLGVDGARIAVDAGGFNQDDVVLTWQDPASQAWALMVTTPEAKAALLAAAPAALAPRLRRWRRAVTFTRRFWQGAIAVTAIAGVALVVGVWQYDALVAWTAQRVSPETELRLGRSVMAGLRREGRLVETGRAVDTVRGIGAKLAQGSERTYEWYVKDDPSVNAFAIPGGFVVVHAGLLDKVDSADELAGVLAHEIQHVEQRHTLQALIYQLGWAALLTIVVGDPTALTTLLLLEVGNLSFSRDLEMRADAAALETLRRAGVRPSAMADFFRKMAGDDGPGALRWLSTHPNTRERIAAAEAAAQALPCPECAPLPHDWAAVRESLYADRLIRRPAQP